MSIGLRQPQVCAACACAAWLACWSRQAWLPTIWLLDCLAGNAVIMSVRVSPVGRCRQGEVFRTFCLNSKIGDALSAGGRTFQICATHRCASQACVARQLANFSHVAHACQIGSDRHGSHGHRTHWVRVRTHQFGVMVLSPRGSITAR